jgi:NADH-quinone oxidoreductase subunit M
LLSLLFSVVAVAFAFLAVIPEGNLLLEPPQDPMNFDPIILTLIIATPLAGAIVLALIPEDQASPNGSKRHAIGALIITLFTLLLTLHLPSHFNYAAAPHTFQFEQNLPWIALSPTTTGIHYHLGVDGLSMWLIVLAAVLAPLGVLASWNTIQTRTKLFYTLFLLQQVAMLGIFVALDLFLYYGFWELSIVPMTLLIATFGRTENRRRAAIKFFLYTFIPSAILLVAILWLYNLTGTFDLPTLQTLAAAHHLAATPTALLLCSIAFLVAFAVKVPIFPLHGWLQEAVIEAPTAAVIVLAGKLGLYSILRFSFGIFPDQSRHVAPVLIALGAIGIVYGALIALIKTDLKKLAAFSTLSHVSFVVLGIFTFTVLGLDGGVFQILNESLIGAAFFILLGLLYERYGTYDMRDYGGLATRHPWMATLFVLTTLAAVGLPMLGGFVGEFLILSGSMQSFAAHHVLWTVIGATGVIIGATYMLWMIQRVFYGSPGVRTEEVHGWDLTPREHLELWPLAALFLIMGIASPFWMRAIDTYGAATADKPAHFDPSNIKRIETETYSSTTSRPVDCTALTVADLADGRCGTVSNVTIARKEAR